MNKRITLLFLLLSLIAKSQLNVTTNSNATALAQAIAGSGVTVSNAVINCDKHGSGTFTYSGSTIGISKGIILTTGYATDASYSAGNTADEETDNDFTDPYLTNINTQATNDVCILTFKFVPICSSMSISYVFGSEEYPDYECSTFNDAFGIFLTGPKPSGGNYTGTNIAALPNGTAVSINNVNDGQGSCSSAHNSAYFNPNYHGTDIVYNGLTKTVTSTTTVTPCQSYTMEIAIADATDHYFDSGVFIQGQALACTNPAVVSATTGPASCGQSNGSATVTVSSYTGTPTYTWTPGGTNTSSISSEAAGSYTCTVGLSGGCSTSYTEAVVAVISPTTTPVTLTVTVSSATVCSGATTTLTASGATNYTWTPSTGLNATTGSSVTSTLTTTTTYTVKGANGTCNNTATSKITVNAVPALTVTPSPSSTICAASTATLTASGANTYTWSSGPTTPTVSINAINSGTTTVTNTISVIGTNTITGCTNSKTYTLTVSPTPTVNLTSSTYTICSGSSTSFSVSTTSGSYVWTVPSGASITSGSTTATPVVTATASAVTTLIYTVTSTVGSCTSVAKTVSLTVNPLPVITISSSTTAICSGNGNSTLTASPGSGVSYTWSPAATLNASTGVTVIATPTNIAAPTVYTVTGIDGNSCSNTKSVSITVNQTPTVTVSGGGGNAQTVCSSYSVAPITFSVNPSSASVSWTNNNTAIGLGASGSGNIAGYTSPTITATTTGIIVATATTSTGGCPSTSATDLTYTITINPLPGVNTPTITPASCGISDGTITGASGIYGSGTYSYEWNNTGGFVASSSYTAAAGTYPLQIKDDITGCIYSQNFTLPNAGAPSAPPITPGSQTVCVGSDAVFSISTPLAGYTYSWTPATGATGTGTSFTVTNVPSSPNPYYINVTATSTANCTGTNATATISILALPTPAISNSTNGQFCQGGSTTLTVTPTGGYSYQWANSGGNIAGATTNTLLVNTAGVYTVTVTNTVTTCSASTSKNGTITVTPAPVVPVISNGISNPLTECQGVTPVTFSLVTNANITPIWNLGSTIVTTGQTYAPSTATPTTNIYSISDSSTVTGCTNALAGNALTVTVTINATPSAPTITGSVPNPLIECQGTTAQTLSLSTTASVTPVWYVGTGTVNIGQTITPSTATPTTTIYVVSDSSTVTGCTSAGAGNVLTVTVTINATPSAPTITGSVPNPLIECQGTTAQTLSLSTTASVTPVWYVGTGTVNIGQTITPSTATPTTTIYVVSDSSTVTGCTSAGAGNVLTVTVTINATPSAPTITGSVPNPLIECQGTTAQTLSLSTTASVTPVWYVGTGTVNIGQTITPSTATPTTTIYVVSDSSTVTGCTSAGAGNVLTVTVTINALPTLSITPSAATTICNGGSQTYTVAGANSYTWTPSATLTGANTANPTASPSTTTTYTVIGTDGNNCSNVMGHDTITLYVTPPPTLSLAGNSYTICSGSSQTFSVSGAISYIWSPLSNINGASTATPTVSPVSSQVYTVTGTTPGCISSPPLTVTLTVNPLPTAPTITASIMNPLIECQGTIAQPISLSTTASVSPVWYVGTSTLTTGQSYTPGTGTVGITIYTIRDSSTVTGCTSAAAGNVLTVTVTINPAPATPSVSVSNNTLTECQGASAQTISVTPTTASLTPVWYVGTGTVTTGNTYMPSTATPTTTIYIISDSVNTPGAGGCTNIAAGNAIQVTVTINPAPATPTVSIVGNTLAECQGVSPQTISISPSTSTLTPKWYNLGSTSSFTVGSYTPSTDSAYTATYLVSDSINVVGGSGCTNIAAGNAIQVTVTINAAPSTPTVSIASNALTECQGVSAQTVSVTPTTSTLTPVWYNVGSASSFTTGSVYTPSTASSYTAAYIISDSVNVPGSGGCTNLMAGNAITVTVTINPAPATPSVSIVGNALTECQGVSAQTISVTPTTSTLTPVWYNVGSASSFTTGSVYTPSTASSYTAAYIISDSVNVPGSGGCTNLMAGNAITVTVNVIPPPSAPTLTNSLQNPLVECQGTTAQTLSLTTTASVIPVWYVGTGTVTTGQSYTPSTATPTTTIYVISDSSAVTSCTSASTGAVLTITVTINPQPTLDVSGAILDTSKCGQATGGVTIGNTAVSNGTPAYHYQWYNGSTAIPNDTTLSLSNVSSGTYSLLVTDSKGCVATVTGGLGTTTFTVPSTTSPTASFSTNPTPATGTIPLNVSFTNLSTNVSSLTTYTWTFGDGNNSNATNPSNTYTNIGSYIAILAASTPGCANTSTMSVTILAEVPTMIIIPNVFSPNNDGVNDLFFIPNTGMASLNCDIFNRWGELLFTITAPDQGWDGRIPNGDKAPDGVYMYILQAQGLDNKTYKQQGTLTLIR